MPAKVHSKNILRIVQIFMGILDLFLLHRLCLSGLGCRLMGGPFLTLGRSAVRAHFSRVGITRPSPELPEPPPTLCDLCRGAPPSTFGVYAWTSVFPVVRGKGFPWRSCAFTFATPAVGPEGSSWYTYAPRNMQTIVVT